MPGRKSRNKGAAGEREALRLLNLYGVHGERNLEQVRTAGHADLDTSIGTVEVKRRANGWKELYRWLEHADLVMLRSDRRPWLVVLPAKEYLVLVETARIHASAMAALRATRRRVPLETRQEGDGSS